MDRFAIRLEELQALMRSLKEDIKKMYKELGYNSEFVYFMYSCVPQGYKAISVVNNTIFLKDDNGCDWHEDNIANVYTLLVVLKSMHHLQPK
jgi:hypothetical protein